MQHREGRVSAGDGLQLAYSDFGDLAAPPAPLLCLPGLTRNAADFRDIARRYGDSRRVICPDYRGRARSAYDADWRHYTPATYLSDIRHLLAALGVHQVVVIGTSLGGILAMFGHKVSRDRLRTVLAWLAEQGLILVNDPGGLKVARLTARGQDVSCGAADCPGVKRPRPEA